MLRILSLKTFTLRKILINIVSVQTKEKDKFSRRKI